MAGSEQHSAEPHGTRGHGGWCVYVGREDAIHEHCLQGALSESRGAGEIARRLHESKIARKLAGIGLKLR